MFQRSEIRREIFYFVCFIRTSDFGILFRTSRLIFFFIFFYFLGCLNFSDTLVLKEHEAHEALWIFGTSMLEERQAP
ncbi:uncharacterized protein OCT59_027998 [Rhizophagus irregularis]|uniref:uncharacterized protein n=1 Tax=Rhizophagus irregularis TaxID=588596 RepID=UPI00331BDB4E|nr:hypothetical protein OCT59_027998 [Rhizophagus irregularis]